MIQGLEKDGEEWDNDEVIDCKKGKYYDCTVWREADDLMIRGYVSMS